MSNKIDTNKVITVGSTLLTNTACGHVISMDTVPSCEALAGPVMLTDCCTASAKGSGGVVCRSCYAPIPASMGGMDLATQLADAGCPCPNSCAALAAHILEQAKADLNNDTEASPDLAMEAHLEWIAEREEAEWL